MLDPCVRRPLIWEVKAVNDGARGIRHVAALYMRGGDGRQRDLTGVGTEARGVLRMTGSSC